MNPKDLKQIFFKLHETTKEHATSRKHYLVTLAGRILLLLALLRDQRLVNVVRSLFAR